MVEKILILPAPIEDFFSNLEAHISEHLPDFINTLSSYLNYQVNYYDYLTPDSCTTILKELAEIFKRYKITYDDFAEAFLCRNEIFRLNGLSVFFTWLRSHFGVFMRLVVFQVELQKVLEKDYEKKQEFINRLLREMLILANFPQSSDGHVVTTDVLEDLLLLYFPDTLDVLKIFSEN